MQRRKPYPKKKYYKSNTPVVPKEPVPERPINQLNTPFLVIVESPSKCEKIEKFLGFQYKCISSKGHIRELVKIGPSKEEYKPTFEVIQSKVSHVSWMRNIIVQFPSRNIFIATDDDREGEGIAWHICEVFDLPVETTPRIIFHEITKPAVQAAINNPMRIRMAIVKAQQTRQILDRMIGFKVSPFLTKLLVHETKEFLSAGRCQTPALRLIYDNEIENEKKQDSELMYTVHGTFFPHPSTTKMTLNRKFSTGAEDVAVQIKDFLNKSQTFSHILSLGDAVHKSQSAPKPFNTSRLLQTASNVLHLSPKQTMAYCQSLYQEGLITYMRTDSTKYSAVFLDKISEFVQSSYNSKAYLGDLDSILNKNKNDPHEAIRVTDIRMTQASSGDARQKSLYNLIRTRTLESCMAPYKAMYSGITLTAPLECKYKSDIEVGEFLGWKRVSITEGEFYKEQQKQVSFRHYCERHIGKAISYHKIAATVSCTETPRHYTEAGLIQKLEEVGIGRPSTFSMLVETLKDREYVKKEDIPGKTIECTEYTLDTLDQQNIIMAMTVQKTFGTEKNKLVIQDLGRKVICQLTEYFEKLFSYDYTARMEDDLDDIISQSEDAVSTVTPYEMCHQCETEIRTSKLPLERKMRKAYDLNDECALVFGKNGAYIKYHDESKGCLSLKPNISIDFDKLETQSYTLEDLMEFSGDSLGIYKGYPLYIKKSKYGVYASWGENTKTLHLNSLEEENKDLASLTYDDVVYLIEGKNEGVCTGKKSGIVRIINDVMSIRTGRYGAYVYYQKTSEETPKFLSLRKFREGYLTCNVEVLLEFLRTIHKIEV